jgi:hypothetical protein
MYVRVVGISYKALTEALSSGTVGEDDRADLGTGVKW